MIFINEDLTARRASLIGTTDSLSEERPEGDGLLDDGRQRYDQRTQQQNQTGKVGV